MITKVMPSAISIGGAAATRIVAVLSYVRKFSQVIDAMITTTTSTASAPCRCTMPTMRSVRSARRLSSATTAAGASGSVAT